MATNRAPSLQVIDPLLTNIARRYQPHGFIYNQLISDVPVNTFTGKYVTFTDQYWFQDEVESLVEDRGPTPEIDYQWSTDSYDCKRRGFKVSLTDEEREQASSQGGFDLESDKVEFLQHRTALNDEIRLAAILKKVSAGTPGALNLGGTPSTNWDQDTAVIETDIQTGVNAIYDAIGLRPNVMVVPFKVAYAMALQQDIRSLFQYTVNGQETLRLGDKILPSTIHGMRLVIPEAVQKDSAREGGTASRSEVWGTSVRLLYINQGAGRYNPSTIKRFVHTPDTVTRWRTNDPDVEFIRSYKRIDEKVVAPDAGYEIIDIL
jgi:hypothetical protein